MQLDRLTQKVMRRFKSHHLSASIERLYLKRLSGGRGLINLFHTWEREVVSTGLYLVGAVEDELLQAVVKHQLFLTNKGRNNVECL